MAREKTFTIELDATGVPDSEVEDFRQAVMATWNVRRQQLALAAKTKPVKVRRDPGRTARRK